MNQYSIFLAIILGLLFYGCDDIFEFSPYQANVKVSDKNQTKRNHETLFETSAQLNDTVYLALMADSHYNYYELEKAIDKINTLNVDFVVHLGDFTDKGLLKEYEFYNDYVFKLKYPVFTCIGNHDYLSNGGKIYKQMFGEYNFTFNYNGIKFIFFDATTFESGKTPDFEWFSKVLGDSLPKVLLSHVPPWDDQYKRADTERFKEITVNKNVVLSVHGHHHNYKFSQNLKTELNFLIPGSVDKKNVCLLKLYGNSKFDYSLIPF